MKDRGLQCLGIVHRTSKEPDHWKVTAHDLKHFSADFHNICPSRQTCTQNDIIHNSRYVYYK